MGESEGHTEQGPHLVEGEGHGERRQGIGEGHRQWGPNLEEQLSEGFTWGGIAVSLKVMGCGHTCNLGLELTNSWYL